VVEKHTEQRKRFLEHFRGLNKNQQGQSNALRTNPAMTSIKQAL
jgi:hypothetical protein